MTFSAGMRRIPQFAQVKPAVIDDVHRSARGAPAIEGNRGIHLSAEEERSL
jgi:hypothetical protein